MGSERVKVVDLLDRLRDFVLGLAENYDHDEAAHRKREYCWVCEAEELADWLRRDVPTPPAPDPAEPPASAALPERWAEFAAYRNADNALRRAEREVNRTEGDPDACRKADAAVRAFTEAENAMVTAYHRLAQRVAELEGERDGRRNA
jgi:hypothetical protein